MTQIDAIREFLEKGNSITPLDALREFGCFRLAAVIFMLRDEGMDIETITEHKNGKKYARYILRDKQRRLF